MAACAVRVPARGPDLDVDMKRDVVFGMPVDPAGTNEEQAGPTTFVRAAARVRRWGRPLECQPGIQP